MDNNQTLARHYAQHDLTKAIKNGITALGKTIETVTIDDLAPVDEFHIGGREATHDLLNQIDLSAQDHVLDIGCGIGGTARFIAQTFGAQVTGIDLTPEYAQTGAEICRWLGLDGQVTLHQGDAINTGFDAGQFDVATMLHVGMNIPDKTALFAEVMRVLRPDGRFAIYDILRLQDTPLQYPVPWLSTAETCAVASLATYQTALTAAGFEVVGTRNRRDLTDAFFAMLKKNVETGNGPPPIGMHLLMGDTMPQKVANMMANIKAGIVAPTEIIAKIPA